MEKKTDNFEKEITIGNIKLDLQHWAGHDDYSDGPIEEELYKRLSDGENPLDILMNDQRYAVLYHLSRERENILSWYPFKGSERVLEVGAGCGAVSGILCQKCGEVTAVELSLMRSKINALRHASETNLRILVQNIMTVEETHDYDIVTLIGVLEYANLFTGTDTPFDDFLRHIKGFLKPEGHLLIAIENRFGIKYFLGAREDHHWKLNEGLYGYPNSGAQTFSAEELLKKLYSSGFRQNSLFSAWPDYKFPTQLKRFEKCEGPAYRDEVLNCGEFIFQTASPRRVMNELISAGLGNQLTNSFFVDASNAATELPSDILLNTNRNQYFTCASIYHDSSKVKKIPIGKESCAIEMIKHGAKLLANRLGSTKILIPEECVDGINLDWLPGTTLHNLICSKECDVPSTWNRYIHQFDQLIFKGSITSYGRTLFKDVDYGNEILVCPAPIDLNFDNIMVNGNDWTVFDTEWVFEEPVPLRYILWRSIFLFEEKSGIVNSELRGFLKLSNDELALFQRMENRFNNYVYGKTSPYQYVKQYLVETEKAEDIYDLIVRLKQQSDEQLLQLKACKSEIKTAWDQFSERERQLDEKRKEIIQLIDEIARLNNHINRTNQLWAVRVEKKMRGLIKH